MVRAVWAAVVVLAAGARAASSNLVGALRSESDLVGALRGPVPSPRGSFVVRPVHGGCILPSAPSPRLTCGSNVAEVPVLGLTFCCWPDNRRYNITMGCQRVNGVVIGVLGCGNVTHSCTRLIPSVPVCMAAPSTASPSTASPSTAPFPTTRSSGAASLAPQVLGVLGALTVVLLLV
jgi:hypothetical protein